MDTGTSTGMLTGIPAGTPDDDEYLPPCRQAGFCIAPCPRCGRELTLKTLHYTHACGRSFDPVQRAREHQPAAEKAINARMAMREQPAERRTEHTTGHTQQNMDNKHKYVNVLRLLMTAWGGLCTLRHFGQQSAPYRFEK